LNRIAKNLFKIRHWKIELGDYSEIVNQAATWFIDPPYQIGGHAYPHSNKKINYDHLSEWCKSRNGQVIVCESEQSNWLPFIPMTVQNTYRGKYRESIWCNEPTQFDNIQLSLL
jgi:16S rRNA G966 N2-methylase RsmD